MKEMTSVTEVMMTEEEREEMEKELKGGSKSPPVGGAPATTPGIAHHEHAAPTPANDPASPLNATSPLTQDGPSAEHPSEKAEAEHASTSASEPTMQEHSAAMSTPEKSSAQSSTPGGSTSPKDMHKRRAKLTPEQKQKIDALSEEREKAMEKRVTDLTDKLKERLRPFVHAAHPGEKDDPETQAWEEKMRKEADDLKLESFGVEVRSTVSQTGHSY
jgi:hypothetical protein